MRHQVNPTSLLVGAVLLMLVLGLTPLRYVRWVGLQHFAGLADTVLTPISGPVSGISRWISPAGNRATKPEELTRLERDRDHYKTLYQRQRIEVERLNRLITELQGGIALNPDLPVRQLAAPVVGSSSDLTNAKLKIRAGTRSGVKPNTVVVVEGVHLVGRVVSVSLRTCWVQLITNRYAASITGIIIVDESTGGPICLLSPVGDGTLRGPVQDIQQGDNSVAVGQLVRLKDPEHAWPRNAQMLVIGRVESVETAPDQELRQIVTVRPVIERLDRVAEVVLRITEEADDEGGTDGGGE